MSSYIHQVSSTQHILDDLHSTPLAKSEFYQQLFYFKENDNT